jgi:ribosomal protein L18
MAPNDHGGYQGLDAGLYDHAYAVCYDLARRAVTASPPGSGPTIYPLDRSLPRAAIGSADLNDLAERDVVRKACADAFRDAGMEQAV